MQSTAGVCCPKGTEVSNSPVDFLLHYTVSGLFIPVMLKVFLAKSKYNICCLEPNWDHVARLSL